MEALGVVWKRLEVSGSVWTHSAERSEAVVVGGGGGGGWSVVVVGRGGWWWVVGGPLY